MRGPGRLPAVERAKLGTEREELAAGGTGRSETGGTNAAADPSSFTTQEVMGVQMCGGTPIWKDTLMASVPLGGGEPAPGSGQGVVRFK